MNVGWAGGGGCAVIPPAGMHKLHRALVQPMGSVELLQPDGEQDVSRAETPTRKRRRPQRRQLFCPKHPDQRIAGSGKKYYIHVESPEELKARGMPEKKARLLIQAYPVLVLDSEWLEQLYCPKCGQNHWCHVSRDDQGKLSVALAKRELWQQVAHVDPLCPNPTVSEYSRREAGRLSSKRNDGRQFYDRP